MAKYAVTHSCGHEQTHDITGPDNRRWPSDKLTRREWIAAQRAKETCDDCKHAARDEQRAAETLAAAVLAAEQGLPVLTGTEKQTAWAERIRVQMLTKFRRTRLADHPTDIADNIMAIVIRAAARRTEAGWWIDSRDNTRNLLNGLTPEENAAIGAFEDLARARLKEGQR